MHIALDIRESCRANRTGKGQWVFGFVSELLEREHPLTLLTDAPLPTQWEHRGVNVRMLPGGFLWHWRAARYLRAHRKIDLYCSPTSFIVPFLLGTSLAHVPVVHDLIAFRGEPHDRKATLIEHCTLHRAVNTACHVCTVSTSAKHDLLERYPSLNTSIVTSIFAGPMHVVSSANNSLDSTILCIGTLCPRKNQERLIQAYTLLPEDLRSQFRLILAGGRGWYDQRIIDRAQKTPGVEYRGYVSAEEYDQLLQRCTVLALPSLYEGFGMQILDALQRGVPILTSARGSLPEVVGDAALLVDPEDERAIEAGLERILRNASLRASLRERGPAQAAKFTWKRTVDLFLQAVGAS